MSFQLSRRPVSLRGILLCAVAFLLSAQGAQAQHSLRGRVLDPNKAALAGAAITANAIGRPASPSTTTTNPNGEFSLSLEPGEYSVQVVAEGFAKTSQIIRLREGDSEPLEIVLQLADSIATVTITDAAGFESGAVISATRTLTPLRDLPQSITVVGGEQMREQSMDSIADAVSYVPGITAHQGENNRDQLVIRGNSTSADFFLNGVRDDVQYYRDLYNVDRLEALKGPNAMIFGRGGGGGVVNRVTKEPGFKPWGEIMLQGGSFGNRRGTIDFNRPLSRNIAFRIDGMSRTPTAFGSS